MIILNIENASYIMSIISSALSIIVFIGGVFVYKKYIKEHINKRTIDSLFGFYTILERLLIWLDSSLQVGNNYALCNFLKSSKEYNNGSTELFQKYDSFRKYILNLLMNNSNQYPLPGKEKVDFESNLKKLVEEILIPYSSESYKKDIFDDFKEVIDTTEKAKKYIKEINEIIENKKIELNEIA